MLPVREQLQKEQDEIVLANAKEEGVPVAIFELIDRGDSGFVLEGTERLPTPSRLDVAGFRQILTKSAYNKIVGGKGKKPEKRRVPIRYRASSESIEPAVQDADDAPANFTNDRIVFVNGRLIVTREGLTIGLYDYLKADSRNETNPDRIPTVTPVYREVFPEKVDASDNERDLQLGRAMRFIDDLIISGSGLDIVYDDNRLEAYAALFNIVSETKAGLVKGLIGYAKIDPLDFVAKVRGMQERVIVEITHGEQFGVILFEGERVIYPSKNKVLTTIPPRTTNKQHFLAGYFMTEKGNYAYREFLIELNAAKEKQMQGSDGDLKPEA